MAFPDGVVFPEGGRSRQPLLHCIYLLEIDTADRVPSLDVFSNTGLEVMFWEKNWPFKTGWSLVTEFTVVCTHIHMCASLVDKI